MECGHGVWRTRCLAWGKELYIGHWGITRGGGGFLGGLDGVDGGTRAGGGPLRGGVGGGDGGRRLGGGRGGGEGDTAEPG